MAKRGLAAAMAAVMWVAACGGGGGGTSSSPPPPPPPPNQAPTADAGEDVQQDIPAAGVELDGAGSSDPDGETLSYQWTITSQPAGGDGSLQNSTSVNPVFLTTVPGDFEIELAVTDPRGASGYDTVLLSLTNTPPTPVAEVSLETPAVGEEVELSGLSSTDPNGQPLTYTWKLESAPAGTAVPVDLTGGVQTVVFDLEGEYQFSLTVSDGVEEVKVDAPLIIVSQYSIRPLSQPYRYLAVQPGGGKVVTAWNATLVTYDADGMEQGSVTLPKTSRSVSVSPDGKLAIVGHEEAVSFVDLEAQEVLATYAVAADIGDVLVSNEGYGYVFPATDQWVSIISVDSRTGTINPNSSGLHRAGTQVKMHPNGRKGYGADNGLSPSDVERYDFAATGAVSVVYDSPYHGDFPFCGDLWISESGSHVLTRCGVVVRATDVQSTDMTYAMQIDGINGVIEDASYNAFSNDWFLVESSVDLPEAEVRVVNALSGAESYTLDLPLSQATSGKQLYARYVAASQDEESVLIFAQDHQTNPQEYYVLKYKAPAASTLDLPPEVRLQKYSAGQTGEQVVVDAGGSFDPEGMSLSFDWTLVSKPDLSDIVPSGLQQAAIQFTPLVEGFYVFDVTVSDGGKTSGPERVTVYASAQPGLDFYRLEGEITDAEYSKSLNVLAYIADNAPVLHLLHLDDLSETQIDLPRRAYSVGISPDGTHAAVSHAALASLVDLAAETVLDTQEYSQDWGDIVLDSNLRAHVIPNRDQHSYFVTLDFAADSYASLYGPYAGTRLRMHPNGVWVYGADVGISPSDFEKWDVSGATAVYKGDSPYHGDYQIQWNLWVSEDGDDILVAGGHLFNASDDPAVDMRYLDTLPGVAYIDWADHSAEKNEWFAAVPVSGDGYEVAIFADTDFQRTGTLDLEIMPPGAVTNPVTPIRLFLTDNGGEALILSRRNTGEDRYFLQISDTP